MTVSASGTVTLHYLASESARQVPEFVVSVGAHRVEASHALGGVVAAGYW